MREENEVRVVTVAAVMAAVMAVETAVAMVVAVEVEVLVLTRAAVVKNSGWIWLRLTVMLDRSA